MIFFQREIHILHTHVDFFFLLSHDFSCEGKSHYEVNDFSGNFSCGRRKEVLDWGIFRHEKIQDF